MAGGLKTAGVDVCADDGSEGSRAADEEGFQREREAAEEMPATVEDCCSPKTYP